MTKEEKKAADNKMIRLHFMDKNSAEENGLKVLYAFWGVGCDGVTQSRDDLASDTDRTSCHGNLAPDLPDQLELAENESKEERPTD